MEKAICNCPDGHRAGHGTEGPRRAGKCESAPSELSDLWRVVSSLWDSISLSVKEGLA